MTTWLVVLGAAVALYALAILALVVAGRRPHAVAIARLIPDALVLVRRLASDPRVARRTRWMLAGPDVVADRWPGPPEGLALIARLSGAAARRPA
jgi:hypothetical protein